MDEVVVGPEDQRKEKDTGEGKERLKCINGLVNINMNERKKYTYRCKKRQQQQQKLNPEACESETEIRMMEHWLTSDHMTQISSILGSKISLVSV